MMHDLFRPEDKPVILIQFVNVFLGAFVFCLLFSWKPLFSIFLSAAALTGLRLLRKTSLGMFWSGYFSHMFNVPCNRSMTASGTGQSMTASGVRQNMTESGAGQNMTESGAGQNMTESGAGQNMTESGVGQNMTESGAGQNMTESGTGQITTATEEGKISRAALIENVLKPSLKSVLEKAEKISGPINRSIGFRVIDRDEKNAFVFCRRHIFITERLLREEPECLQAVLMHEIGHLQDLSTLLGEWNCAGEWFVTILNKLPGLVALYKMGTALWLLFEGNGTASLAALKQCLGLLLFSVLLTLGLGIWYRVRSPFLLEYRRGCERAADAYVIRAGLGDMLSQAIERLSTADSIMGKERSSMAASAMGKERSSMGASAMGKERRSIVASVMGKKRYDIAACPSFSGHDR